MSRRPIHYELFARRTPQSSWTLHLANEDRAYVIEQAEELLAEKRAAAVKVNKEVFDVATGEFSSATILQKGVTETRGKLKLAPETDTVCTSPQDLYTLHAREKIGRLLEDWLRRHRATPFELLHRPDLVEKLEASGNDLQHVVQKIAIPESQETGQDLHDLMRRWRALIDRAIARVIQDGRRKLFPDIDPANWLGTIDKIASHPERAYVLGGGVAKILAGCQGSAQKLEALLIFGRLLSEDLGGREWALQVLEIPVTELFGERTSLNDLLGHQADLGEALAVMTRMAAGDEVEQIAALDPTVGRVIPKLTGALAGYHDLMSRDCFPTLSQSVSKRLVAELKGPRRLKPGNPEAEIETLRALALCLTAAGKEEAQRDDVRDAFAERSKMLVSSDFVDSLIRQAPTAVEEAEKLLWLCENVVGAANKRQAARWLISSLTALKFERELRSTERQPSARLQILAKLQRRARQAGLQDKDIEDTCARLGLVGSLVAQDVNLISSLSRAKVPPVQKLSILLGLATGNTGPTGPVADQAKAEVVKLMRAPELRQILAQNPEAASALRPLLQNAGLAA